MQLAHAVEAIGRADGEDGHREGRRLVVHVDPAEAEQVGVGEAERRAVRLEVAPHEVRVEGVVPGRDGGVRGEDVGGAVRLGGHGEGSAALAHDAADPLERQERRVALVHVADGRRQPDGLEGVDPPDAEHDLLTNPELLVPAVERTRDGAIGRRVLGEVRVEQEQRDPPDLHLARAAPSRRRRGSARR